MLHKATKNAVSHSPNSEEDMRVLVEKINAALVRIEELIPLIQKNSEEELAIVRELEKT